MEATFVVDKTMQAMLLIQSLDSNACLRLSRYTHGWYVEARIEIGNGVFLTGITEHEATPDEAVNVYLDRLRAVDGDERIVTYTYDLPRVARTRHEWLWNGAAFVLNPGPRNES